jgi:AcrR family transcriptional regulator
MVRPRQFLDEDLLAVARACFIEHGPGCSTALIADEAGVSQATLFKRFGTKRQLLRAALKPEPPLELLGGIGAGPDARPLPDQLHDIASALLGMFDRLLPCVMTLWAAGEDPAGVIPEIGGQPPPVQVRRMLRAWFEQATATGRAAPGDADVRAMAFIGACKERSFQHHLFPGSGVQPSAEAYAQSLVDTFWAGCAPAETP